MGTVRALSEGGHPVDAGDTRPGDRVNAMPPTAIDHASMGGPSMSHTASAATVPQITAVTLLSVLIPAAGVLLGALYGEFTMRGEMPEHGSAPHATVTAPPAL